MKIIVDDFGINNKANLTIIEAIKRKVIWGASVMVAAPGTKGAADFIKTTKARCKYGLHFNITEGKPLLRPGLVSTLIDDSGNFLGWTKLIKADLKGKINSRDIEAELEAQLKAFLAADKKITFFNSHHHIHLWPRFAKIIKPVIEEFNIKYVRCPKKICWGGLPRAHRIKAFVIQSIGKLKKYHKRSLSTWMVDLDWAGTDDVARGKIFNNLPDDCELICHPNEPSGSADISTLQWIINNKHD